MIITHPTEHKWIEIITENPISELGKNNQARIRSSLNAIDKTTISYSIEPLTNEILDWFVPLYQKTINAKSNPNPYDIAANTINKNSKFNYFALILRENDIPIGATIFSKRTHIVSIAYRIYPHNWLHNNLQASPSLFSEYLINKYGYAEGYKKLAHGKDRNPYGLNASIGLALFKLSVGCNVYLPSTPYEIKNLDLDSVTEDILLFEMPIGDEKQISKGYLYVTEANLTKYENVTKYPNQIKIEVILRN